MDASKIVIGKVVNVYTVKAAQRVGADTAAGVLIVPVDDVEVLSETGGEVRIETNDYFYSTISGDDETGWFIHLTTALVGAVDEDDEILVLPTAEEKWALVDLDDEDDAKEARILHRLQDSLEEGAREERKMENVEIEMRGAELVVTNIVGDRAFVDGSYLDPETIPAGGQNYFWKEEVVTINEAHMALGSVTMRLSHIPEPESFLAWWHPESE